MNCQHGINTKHGNCERCEEIAEAEHRIALKSAPSAAEQYANHDHKLLAAERMEHDALNCSIPDCPRHSNRKFQHSKPPFPANQDEVNAIGKAQDAALRSEQQEWTPKRVARIIGWKIEQTNAEQDIILRRITAALAAERQRREQAEGAQHHMEACRSLLNVPDDEVLYQVIKDMQEQLLSALAANRKARKILEHSDVPLHVETVKALDGINLSLLRQHHAEVRNPLVEALNVLLDCVDYMANNCHVNSMVGAVLDVAVIEKVRAALAQLETK